MAKEVVFYPHRPNIAIITHGSGVVGHGTIYIETAVAKLILAA